MNSNPNGSVSKDGATGKPRAVISLKKQRIISVGLIALAFVALGLATYYQDDDKLGQGRVNQAAFEAAGGTEAVPENAAVGAAPVTTLAPGQPGSNYPIEAFLPKSGEASACREPVGVDLIPGYGATLTINGREIKPEEMNVNLALDGSITNEITASRSIGQFTFTPTDECPNGTFLRPIDNVLEVCVYRIEDPSRACSVNERYVFDAA